MTIFQGISGRLPLIPDIIMAKGIFVKIVFKSKHARFLIRVDQGKRVSIYAERRWV